MIKVDYNFTTKSFLHTGSDEEAGTLKTLRRQKIIPIKPITYQSRLTDETRINAIVYVLINIWDSINWDNITGKRAMTIWEEFHSKAIAACRASTKYNFIQKICKSWGIQNIRNKKTVEVLDILNDDELIDTVRNNMIYILMKMRSIKDDAKENKKTTGMKSYEFGDIKQGKIREITKNELTIPIITGNSIRGKLRRYAMSNFLNIIDIKEIPKRTYHILFTGGILDQSTANIDIGKLDEITTKNPMLSLFGSAIGNMTIEGLINVGFAYPLCQERGTAKESFWSFLDTIFQTRLDSSKTENSIKINDEKSLKNPMQMKYEYEVFVPGTKFEHKFVLKSNDELHVSAFWHVMNLHKKHSSLGGMSAVGNGDIDLSGLVVPSHSEACYVDYLKTNAKDFKEFWENVNI